MSGVGSQKEEEEEEEEEKKPVVARRPRSTVPVTYYQLPPQPVYDDPAAQKHINLKVKGQDGSEVIFRVKRATQLYKMMLAYCDQRCVAMNSFVFLFDGRRLCAEQTPYDLAMEEGDEIDAMLHQTGGTSTF